MDDVPLACSVPSPTMHLSRLEGVVEKRGPHWGTTVVITFSCWGRRSPGKRPEEPTSVIESSQSYVGLASGCSVGPGPARWGGPPCSQASYPGEAAGGVLAAFRVVPAPSTVTPGSCHMETLLPNSPCRAEPEAWVPTPALLCSHLPYRTPAPPWCLRVSGCSGIYSCFHLLGVAP